MKNNFEIITLTSESWYDFKNLRLNALKTDPQAFLSTFEKQSNYPDEKWRERLEIANEGIRSWILFAEENSQLVGMVGGYRSDDNLKDNSAEIWGVYVKPDKRGKGIAKALLKNIINTLSENPDISLIKLEVNIDQEVAKKLYEDLNFVITGTSNIILGDGKEHKVAAMERKAKLL